MSKEDETLDNRTFDTSERDLLEFRGMPVRSWFRFFRRIELRNVSAHCSTPAREVCNVYNVDVRNVLCFATVCFVAMYVPGFLELRFRRLSAH